MELKIKFEVHTVDHMGFEKARNLILLLSQHLSSSASGQQLLSNLLIFFLKVGDSLSNQDESVFGFFLKESKILSHHLCVQFFHSSLIDQIEDKEGKTKYIRKVLEQQNSKPKPKINLSNAYPMKDLFQYYKTQEPATLKDLQEEVKQIKVQIEEIKSYTQNIDFRLINLEKQKDNLSNEEFETFVHSMNIVQKQRWYTKITLKINPDYKESFIALIDSGADLNCIQEGLIPTVYFVKTAQRLSTASNDPLKVQYKIPEGHICKKGICIKTSFLLVKNISHQIVLGTPFLTQLYPFQIDSQGLRLKIFRIKTPKSHHS